MNKITFVFTLIISILITSCDAYTQTIKNKDDRFQSNHQRRVIKTKKYYRDRANPDLNHEEIEKIIKENQLEEKRVHILNKKNKKCSPPPSISSDPKLDSLSSQERQDQKQKEDERLRREREEQNRDSNQDQIGAQTNFRIPSNSDEAAVILLVVVGVVVIIYWLATVPALLSKMANDDGCIISIKNIFVEYHNYRFSNEYQDGNTYSAEFNYYFKHKYDNMIYYGFNAIFGEAHLTFAEGDQLSRKERGSYFLVGPSLLFPISMDQNGRGTAIHMDFLLGSSSNSQIGGMAAGRLGIQYSNKDGMLFGLGVSGNQFNINQNDSFTRSNSRTGLSTFLRFGWSF